MIRVVIVDDHPIIRTGLRKLLEGQPHIQIVGEAGTGKEALECVQALQPDILLLDLQLPDRSGIEVAQVLYQRKSQVKIIIISASHHPIMSRRLLRYKIMGYILKEDAPESIVDAINSAVYRRERRFSDKVIFQLNRSIRESFAGEDRPQKKRLSLRELEVLRLIAEGKTNDGVGRALNISPKTVEKHLVSIYRKLDVHSRAEAAVLATRDGFL